VLACSAQTCLGKRAREGAAWRFGASGRPRDKSCLFPNPAKSVSSKHWVHAKYEGREPEANRPPTSPRKRPPARSTASRSAARIPLTLLGGGAVGSMASELEGGWGDGLRYLASGTSSQLHGPAWSSSSTSAADVAKILPPGGWLAGPSSSSSSWTSAPRRLGGPHTHSRDDGRGRAPARN